MAGASRPARSHPSSTRRRPSSVQLFQTTLGAARRDGDELVVLDGPADLLAWAMSDDRSAAAGNGQVRQVADTDELIFAIPEIVATVSQSVALHPGDVILTGPPAGVGLVQAQFLSPGDVVEVTVGAIPPLRNEVAAAAAYEERP
jgi:hypothetical protein